MTLTTERMAEIAKLAIRLQQISGCAAVTSSGETIMHHTFVDTILSALHDVTAELLANREAQPVATVLFSPHGVNVSTIDVALPDGTKLYTAPPAPAVPDALANDIDSDDHPLLWSYNNGWNACRAAMLAKPVSGGYKLVPVDLTDRMIDAFNETPPGTLSIEDLWRALLAAAPEGGN